MKLETAGRSMWRNFTEAKTEREMHDNQEVEEEIPRNEEDIGPEVIGVRGKSSNKRTEKQQSFRDRQYTSREAQKLRGRCHMTELTRICQDIYTMGVWPEDFLQSIIIPIKKKPNATACEDHRTISLLTHASKVMIRILTKRVGLQAKTEAIGGEVRR